MGEYSSAPEAAAKKKIDDAIAAAGGTVDMTSEAYLKELISRATGGKRTVSSKTKLLQFFIVRGGAEGFLDWGYKGSNASRVVHVSGVTTSGQAPIASTFIFDENDLIIAFDTTGKLIGSALLKRPLSINGMWSEKTANAVYDHWDGQLVSIYHNTSFDVTYYGLGVEDTLKLRSSGKVVVDLHKEEATNGCIFIVDPLTPPYNENHTDVLSAFEPKFIKDVQKAIGASTKPDFGVMNMIEVK